MRGSSEAHPLLTPPIPLGFFFSFAEAGPLATSVPPSSSAAPAPTPMPEQAKGDPASIALPPASELVLALDQPVRPSVRPCVAAWGCVLTCLKLTPRALGCGSLAHKVEEGKMSSSHAKLGAACRPLPSR